MIDYYLMTKKKIVQKTFQNGRNKLKKMQKHIQRWMQIPYLKN